MEIKYKFLYMQENKSSLNSLFNSKMHGDLLKSVHQVQRGLEKEYKNLQDLYTMVMKDYVEQDEKGPKIGEDGLPIPKPGKKEEWDLKVKELLEKKFEIKAKKINVNNLYNAGLQLTSVDIQNLEPILSGLDFELSSV